MNFHLLVIAVYSVTLLLLGVWLSRRVKNADDFFVAGRSLSPGLIGATVLAANIGAGTTVGAAGIGYTRGISSWWWVGTAGLGAIFIAFWLGPRFWKIARDNGFLTVGDFIEDRYGPVVRATITGLLWIGTPFLLAAQIMALGFVLDVVAGIPAQVSYVAGGLVMITYFTAGGLAGAAWINAIQLVVLLGGFAVAVPLALASVGGLEGLTQSAQTVGGDYTSIWGPADANPMFYLALLLPNFMISPGIIQKIYGARDASAIRWGIGISSVVLLVFATAPALLGMVARVQFPVLEGPEYALPTVLKDGLPIFIGALGLGAIFMAEISSADAILFMLSTSLSKDLYKRFLAPEASSADVLRIARWAAVGGGLLSIGFALISETIVDALTVFYSLVGIVLFVPMLAGLFHGNTRPAAAMGAILGGVGTYLVARVTVTAPLLGFVTPNLLALLVAAGAYGAVTVAKARG